MLLGADSRVCLAGGRAQSVLHFTQQQTGEKAGGVNSKREKKRETEQEQRKTGRPRLVQKAQRTVSHVQLWFQIQVQLWRGHFISFSPELAKRQVNRHWQQDCRNHNHEYELHYLTWALTSEDFLKELELVGCTGFSELAPALAPYHRLVPLWDLCGFIWGSGRPRWQWTEATGRAMEGWSHNQLTPLSHVSEGGSGERLAAIRRWGQLQPPINDSSTGSQMEIFVGWCFWPNVPSPSSRLKLD